MTTRKTEARDRWRHNPYYRTFFEYTAWVCAFWVAIVVYWITPFEEMGPVGEVALMFSSPFLLFAAPVALVAGSGWLMRLLIRRRSSPAEAADGNGRPQFYWPWQHYLQAFLSAVGGMVVGYLDIIDSSNLPPYWVAFPWCVEGLTLCGVWAMRTLAFALCFEPGRLGAWAAATWARGAWDRLGDLLIAASLSFLIVTCATMGLFVGSSDEFPEWCAWVMAFSLVPLGLMLAGRGARLVWKWACKGPTVHIV